MDQPADANPPVLLSAPPPGGGPEFQPSFEDPENAFAPTYRVVVHCLIVWTPLFHILKLTASEKLRLLKVFFRVSIRFMANHPLREYRTGAGLTLAEMAEKTGMSVPSLCRIELGQQAPSLKLIAKLIKLSRGKLRADDFLEA